MTEVDGWTRTPAGGVRYEITMTTWPKARPVLAEFPKEFAKGRQVRSMDRPWSQKHLTLSIELLPRHDRHAAR
jgi:hypothetical protein